MPILSAVNVHFGPRSWQIERPFDYWPPITLDVQLKILQSHITTFHETMHDLHIPRFNPEVRSCFLSEQAIMHSRQNLSLFISNTLMVEMPKKTYLRPPNDDYAPDNNIQLGCVWRDPRDPASFVGDPLLIPPDIKINHTYKGSWTIDLGRESHGKIGFWAKISQLPVTAAARTRWDNAEDSAYRIPTMDTYSIEPTPAYVKASVASVSAEILKSGDNLYMITGVKIARGGEGSNRESKNFGTGIQVGVDATAAGAPVEVGKQVYYARGAHNNQGFGATGDFVFAYRVREIFYKKGVLKTREHNKGAVLGEDMIPVGKSEGGEPELVIEDAEVGDDDVEVDGGEHYSFVDDDGEECDIVV